MLTGRCLACSYLDTEPVHDRMEVWLLPPDSGAPGVLAEEQSPLLLNRVTSGYRGLLSPPEIITVTAPSEAARVILVSFVTDDINQATGFVIRCVLGMHLALSTRTAHKMRKMPAP